MSQATQLSKEKPDYFYLRYVTLGQLFKELKDLTPWWCCLFALALAGAVFDLPAVPEISDRALKQLLFWGKSSEFQLGLYVRQDDSCDASQAQPCSMGATKH